MEAARYWGAIIGGRYMGMERAEEFGKRAEGEWVLRVILKR